MRDEHGHLDPGTRAGDLYVRMRADLLRYATRVLKNVEDAEDVVQDVGIALTRYDGEAREGLVWTILTYRVIEVLRQRSRARMRTSLDAASDVADGREDSDPRHVVEKNEEFELVADAIDAVTPDLETVDKQIFAMRFRGNVSFKDIGLAVGRTPEAVRLRYFRIFKRIEAAGRRRLEVHPGTTF
ncbi:MAG: sigma-70 family RNA polymerase sigma factor [Planctomycetes bacterium]|nr:sigma-70 family RNA polymerase sigma factor [Planctomycetota bacterium]